MRSFPGRQLLQRPAVAVRVGEEDERPPRLHVDVTHRHPEFWPDPEAFDPDRFTPERSAGRPRFAWYPFLGGPHQCIGQEFAVLEAVVAIATVVRSFRLTLPPGAVVEPEPVLTLRPRGGMNVTVEPR